MLGDGRLSVGRGISTDVVIGQIASRQRGRMTRRQLLASGVSGSAIDRRLRSGRLIAVHDGVYGLPHTAELPLADEAAALLACGPGAALSHHSAATLWGLRPGRARPVHVTIPEDRGRPLLRGVIVHRSRILTPADIRVVDGLPVTSPARTLLDVAASLPDRDVERLLYEAIYVRRLVTPAAINQLLKRSGGHPGRRRLTRVAAAPQRDTNSPVAETLLQMIRDAGLPEPQTEVWVLDYRLDFYWPELKLAVEVDAYGTHGSPVRFEDDRKRDARLFAELGIVVIRITRAMIEGRPLEALASVARAIAQQEAAIGSARSRLR
jgi:very-short-patch-repair endonuclease